MHLRKTAATLASSMTRMRVWNSRCGAGAAWTAARHVGHVGSRGFASTHPWMHFAQKLWPHCSPCGEFLRSRQMSHVAPLRSVPTFACSRSTAVAGSGPGSSPASTRGRFGPLSLADTAPWRSRLSPWSRSPPPAAAGKGGRGSASTGSAAPLHAANASAASRWIVTISAAVGSWCTSKNTYLLAPRRTATEIPRARDRATCICGTHLWQAPPAGSSVRTGKDSATGSRRDERWRRLQSK